MKLTERLTYAAMGAALCFCGQGLYREIVNPPTVKIEMQNLDDHKNCRIDVTSNTFKIRHAYAYCYEDSVKSVEDVLNYARKKLVSKEGSKVLREGISEIEITVRQE
mgnify:CR=1 FL=1